MNAAKFSGLIREMAKTPSRISSAVAADISQEIQRNFDRGLDFDRKPWRRLAYSTLQSGRHPPPLTDTGRGRRSIRVTAMAGAGVRITVGVGYMMFHQFGGRGGRPPQRSFLPFDKIPRAWGEIVHHRYEQAAQRAFQ